MATKVPVDERIWKGIGSDSDKPYEYLTCGKQVESPSGLILAVGTKVKVISKKDNANGDPVYTVRLDNGEKFEVEDGMITSDQAPEKPMGRSADFSDSKFTEEEDEKFGSDPDYLSEKAAHFNTKEHHEAAAEAHDKAAKSKDRKKSKNYHEFMAQSHRGACEHADGKPLFSKSVKKTDAANFGKAEDADASLIEVASFSVGNALPAKEIVNGIPHVRRPIPLLFRTGNYPDKEFSMSVDEAKNAHNRFKPTAIGLSHVHSVFDGKLGIVDKLEIVQKDDAAEFSGSALIPEWLDNHLCKDGEYNVSAAWHKGTKDLLRVDIVPKGRIEGAKIVADLTAAFSAATGKKPEDIVSFAMNPIAGGNQIPVNPPPPPSSPPPNGADEAVDVSDLEDNRGPKIGHDLFNELTSLCDAALGYAEGHKGSFSPAYISTLEKIKGMCEKQMGKVPPPPPADKTGTDGDLEKTAGFSEDKIKLIESQAALFATESVAKKLAYAYEIEQLKKDYKIAAVDDARSPAMFSDGKTRVEILKDRINSRQPHKMDEDLVAVFSKSGQSAEEQRKQLSEQQKAERKKYLLSQTDAGRYALNGK